MLKASELRIGNWVKWEYPYTDGSDWKVKIRSDYYRIDINTFYSEVSSQSEGRKIFSELYPIPLSPDILVKCRFEQEIYGVWYTLYRNKLILDIDCENGLFEIDESGKEYPIKYLHQLQNLFFALCGEELNIQL